MAGGGQGPEHDRCLALAARLGGQATVHGYVSHRRLARLMQQAHIQVLPSFFEGLPLVLFEGLASGCRIIAANLSGFTEFFSGAHPDTVRLIDLPALETIDRPFEKDEVHLEKLLAKTLEEMMAVARRRPDVDDPGADKIARNYTWQRVFENVLTVYETVARKPRMAGV
jgi:glycosyltransferase involved in cell wall biosynthesis